MLIFAQYVFLIVFQNEDKLIINDTKNTGGYVWGRR